MTDWSWWSFGVGLVCSLLAACAVWMYIEFRDAPILTDAPNPIPDEELGR